MDNNITATVEGWEKYQNTLKQYIELSRKDLSYIIANKLDRIRYHIFVGLSKQSPSKNKIKREAKGRDWATKLNNEKAIAIANLILPHKQDYEAKFSELGITFDEDTKKLTPKMMSRVLATVTEIKKRQGTRKFHASTFRKINVPKSGQNISYQQTTLNNKNTTSINFKTDSENPSASLTNSSPRILELLYGKGILGNVLAREEDDMKDYIARKLEENKNKTNLK